MQRLLLNLLHDALKLPDKIVDAPHELPDLILRSDRDALRQVSLIALDFVDDHIQMSACPLCRLRHGSVHTERHHHGKQYVGKEHHSHARIERGRLCRALRRDLIRLRAQHSMKGIRLFLYAHNQLIHALIRRSHALCIARLIPLRHLTYGIL